MVGGARLGWVLGGVASRPLGGARLGWALGGVASRPLLLVVVKTAGGYLGRGLQGVRLPRGAGRARRAATATADGNAEDGHPRQVSRAAPGVRGGVEGRCRVGEGTSGREGGGGARHIVRLLDGTGGSHAHRMHLHDRVASRGGRGLRLGGVGRGTGGGSDGHVGAARETLAFVGVGVTSLGLAVLNLHAAPVEGACVCVPGGVEGGGGGDGSLAVRWGWRGVTSRGASCGGFWRGGFFFFTGSGGRG